ncbi:hypothetical protein MKW92_037840 [Papaver armeniacum]|nr:hypothetical protein MKW92_037840 [Papaver armeniacum]
MALKNVTKMLSWRWFSNGTRSGIWDSKLLDFCVRLEQATEEANQLRDEYNTICAIKRRFLRDQRIWLGLICSLTADIGVQFKFISQRRKAVKEKESQLSAIRTKKQELQFRRASIF